MSSRNRRTKSVFSLEPLEGRSAPSHVGLLAHALVHAHRAQPAAQVAKLNVHKVHVPAHPAESKSAVDTSLDASKKEASGADKNSPDPAGTDKSSPDPAGTDKNSPDPAGTDKNSPDPGGSR